MTEEEEDEESIFLVEGVPRKPRASRDGSLFIDQVSEGFNTGDTEFFHDVFVINRAIYL